MSWQEFLAAELATPGKLIGHLSYVLLVASMMMRSMKKLRIVAVSSGIVSIVYGYFLLRDYVVVIWETIFVTVNLVQLLFLEWENKRARFNSDETRFVEKALRGVERAHARRVLAQSERKEFEPGATLIQEGESVDHLLFILDGAISVERDHHIVGVCGPGDFLGEISFMDDTPATATASVTHPVTALSFSRPGLSALIAKDAEIRRAFEAGFNRGLVEKLVNSNAMVTNLSGGSK